MKIYNLGVLVPKYFFRSLRTVDFGILLPERGGQFQAGFLNNSRPPDHFPRGLDLQGFGQNL